METYIEKLLLNLCILFLKNSECISTHYAIAFYIKSPYVQTLSFVY